jgi:hypothetical protein
LSFVLSFLAGKQRPLTLEEFDDGVHHRAHTRQRAQIAVHQQPLVGKDIGDRTVDPMKKVLWVVPMLLMVGACGHRYDFYKGDMSNFVPDQAECGSSADAIGVKSLVLRGHHWGTYMQCMKLRGYVDANP